MEEKGLCGLSGALVMPEAGDGGEGLAHLLQLTPRAGPTAGLPVPEDEVQLLRADAQGAGSGQLGDHVTDS